MSELQEILRLTKVSDADLVLLSRVGSRVYGTASARSDRDYVAVIRGDGPRDIVRARGVSVVVIYEKQFVESLSEQNVFCLEALMAPTEHRLKEPAGRIPYRIQKTRLADAARERSDADYAKAEARYGTEPALAKKRLLHSVRVAAFAAQLTETGAITDFQVAASWWDMIQVAESWAELESEFGPLRSELLSRLGR